MALGAGILVGQHPLALSFTHPVFQPPTGTDSSGVDSSFDVPLESLEFNSSAELLIASLIAPVAAEDGLAAQQVASYLSRLGSRGFSPVQQGVWLQTQDHYLFDHQGSIPLPAASLVKVAVTLAALDRFGAEHRFQTQFIPTGPIEAGTLRGDLVVIGGEDPFFVWEAAVSVAQRLQEAGIQRIEGDLVIQGRFYMNFLTDPARSGNLLQQGLNAAIWPAEAEAQFQTLPSGTPRPQIEILGTVRVADPGRTTGEMAAVRHYSLPLADLLKLMNRYSNNLMADMVALAVGGHQQVAARSSQLIGIPRSEIQLINGSGLGMENRMSPRAVVGLFLQIQKLAGSAGLSVGDLFEVVGMDEGVLEQRLLPAPLVAKSGTLNQVSSLAGVIPTRDRGLIWFAIMNQSPELVYAREQQGRLLSDLQQEWGRESNLPATLQPQPNRQGLRF
ncbi:MAG: D-alanyl-D-alanine carboxypeptidase [Synechococcaceae cyanobacterium RM1_1_27]|nr:D-alanyl-D-alanine carboxypeptidase [Synechococcaceae cyanobacterium RM1_1_27]